MAKKSDRADKAVMYLRVASSHHDDLGAIARQREACQRIADKYGLVVLREYVDVGQPARFERQLELQRLFADLAKLRDATSIIVWDYARLARDMAQLEEVISQLRARGAEVVTLTGVEVAQRFVSQQQADAGSDSTD